MTASRHVMARTVTFAVLAMAVGALCVMTAPIAYSDEPLRLSVSPDARYLVDGDGKPFFWLADTGWALFSSLTVEEAERYLENRKQKGFNVIQCIIAHWSASDLRSAPDGQAPWLENDPTTPDPGYIAHVDAILQIAQEKGIILALLPAWGDLVTQDKLINANNAYDYGLWLGDHYREAPNVVWVLGGDRPATGYEQVFAELARGLSDGDAGGHLRTYHPRGGGHSSSEFFHAAQWLDFNMIQSSHSIDYPNHENVLRDYAKRPTKPTLDGEPRYENIINGLRAEGLRIDDHDVRKAAYGAVLSGALGHTYGCNGIFQFSRAGEDGRYASDVDWEAAMDLPGAGHMQYLKRLMLAGSWPDLTPDQSVVLKGSAKGRTYVPAARASDGTFIYAYVPERQTVTIDMSKIGGVGAKAFWYDPRTGESEPIGEFDNTGAKAFTPPTGPGDPDYVLVVASAGPDVTPPTIADVITRGDPTRVYVRFSEPVDGKAASDPASYTIEPGVTVALASSDDSGLIATLATSLLTEGTQYTLSVSDIVDLSTQPNTVAEDTKAQFVYTKKPQRITKGLQALYTFDGEGLTATDTAMAGAPLDLTVPEPPAVNRVPSGLSVQASAQIASEGPAEELIAACMDSNELTIEGWFKPDNVTQSGPARIITLSGDSAVRNFTLGQAADRYEIRLRTTATSTQGTPAVATDPGTAQAELTHFVYTRDAVGLAVVYINGEEVTNAQVGGDFSNWTQFRFGLANEFTDDRTWLGELYLAAIYDRALTPSEVQHNFGAGAGTPTAP